MKHKRLLLAIPLLFSLFSFTPARATIEYTPPTEHRTQGEITTKQVQRYTKPEKAEWPTAVPYAPELEGKLLTLYDVLLGYADNEIVERYYILTEDEQKLSAPILEMVPQLGEPRAYPTGFKREFSDMFINPLTSDRKELAILYKYKDKQAIEIFDPEKMQISEILESDKIQTLDNGNVVATTVFNQNGIRRFVINTYEIKGIDFLEKETPAEIKTAEAMDFLISQPTEEEVGYLKTDLGSEALDTAANYLIKVEENKPKLEATILSNPSQAVKQAEEILGTDNPLLVAEALKKSMEDLYAVDQQTDEAKPLWNYILEYQVGQGEAEAKVNVDALIVYYGLKYGLKQTPIGGIPLPWAGGEELAVVVAREVTKDIASKPGSTYLYIRIREEDGEIKLEGDIGVGSRAIQLYDKMNVYVAVAQETYKENKSYITEGKWKDDAETFLKKTDEMNRERQRQQEKENEEAVKWLKEKSTELGEKVDQARQEGNRQIQEEYEKQKRQTEQLVREIQRELDKIPKNIEDWWEKYTNK